MNLPADFEALRFSSDVGSLEEVQLVEEQGKKVIKLRNAQDPKQKALGREYMEELFKACASQLQETKDTCVLLLNSREITTLVHSLQELSRNTHILERFLSSPVAKKEIPLPSMVTAAERQVKEYHALIQQNALELVEEIKKGIKQEGFNKDHAALFDDLVELIVHENLDVRDEELQKLHMQHWLKTEAGPLVMWLERDGESLIRLETLPLADQKACLAKCLKTLNGRLSREGIEKCRKHIQSQERKVICRMDLKLVVDPDLKQLLEKERWKKGERWIPQIIQLWQEGEKDLVKEIVAFFAQRSKDFRFEAFSKVFFKPEENFVKADTLKKRLKRAQDYAASLPADAWDLAALPLSIKDEPYQEVLRSILNLKINKDVKSKLYNLVSNDLAYVHKLLDLFNKYPDWQTGLLYLWKNLSQKQLLDIKPLFEYYTSVDIHYITRFAYFLKKRPKIAEPLLRLPTDTLYTILMLKKNVKDLTQKDIKEYFSQTNQKGTYLALYVPYKIKNAWQLPLRRLVEAHPELNLPLKKWIDALYVLHTGAHEFEWLGGPILKTDDEKMPYLIETVFKFDAPVGRASSEKSSNGHLWGKSYWPCLIFFTRLPVEQIKLALEFGALQPLAPRMISVLSILQKDPPLATLLLQMAKDHPKLIPHFFNCYHAAGFNLSKQLLERWAGPQKKEMTLVLQAGVFDPHHLEALLSLETLRLPITPQLIQTASKLPSALCYPLVFNIMTENPQFLEELALLSRRMGKEFFQDVLKNLNYFIEKDPTTALQIVHTLHSYPRILFAALKDPSLLLLLNRLDQIPPRHRNLIKEKVFSILETHPGERTLVESLIDKTSSAGWPFLVGRLLDLVQAGFSKDVELVLKRMENLKNENLEYKFIHSLLIQANSSSIQTLREGLSLDPAVHQVLMEYVISHELVDQVQFSKTSQAMIHAAANGKTALLSALLSAAQDENKTPRGKALLAWAEEGNWALAEHVLSQPEAIWEKESLNLEPRHMEQLWDIDEKWILYCLSLSRHFNGNELWDALGMVQYLLRHDRASLEALSAHPVDKTTYKKLEKALESSPHSPSKIMREFLSPFKSETRAETAFTLGIARCLLTASGHLNLAMIERIKKTFLTGGEPQSRFAKLFRMKQGFPANTDFNHHLIALLDSSKNLSMIIASFKSSEIKNSRLLTALKNMFGKSDEKELTDEEARVALLSALMTRIRQHENVGSCFATQTAIETHSSPFKREQALNDYKELMATGTLKAVQKGASRQYPLTIEPHYTLESHPLVRAREYTLAQMGKWYIQEALFQKNLNFFEENSPIFKTWSHLITLTPPPMPALNAELFANQLKQQFLKNAYITYEATGKESQKHIGFWGLSYDGKVIKTPDDYYQFFKKLTDLTQAELNLKFPGHLAYIDLICGQFMGQFFKETLPAMFTLESGSKAIQNSYSDYEELKKCPWGIYKGGYSEKVRQGYYGMEETPNEYPIFSQEPQFTFQCALEQLKKYPQNLREAILNNPRLLIPHNYTKHAANWMPHEMASLIFEKNLSPAQIIQEGHQEADRMRNQVANPALKKELAKQFAKTWPRYRLEPLLQEVFKDAQTVGEICTRFSEQIMKLGVDYQGDSSYENILRTCLLNNHYKVPTVIKVLDLNYDAKGHNNQYLGFGPSLFKPGTYSQFLCKGPSDPPQAVSAKAYGGGEWLYFSPADLPL